MKKLNSKLAEKLTTYIFYTSVLFFFISFNFQDTKTSGWYQQFLPNLGGKSISDITFLDSLIGYAVARQNLDSSYVLKTTNGGDNWNIIYRNYFAMTGIKFLNLNTGFACGAYLYKTTNGGFNWNQVNAPAISPEGLWVINDSIIWIISSESLTGGAYLTTNGGTSWQQKFSGGTENPNKIYMYNARIGFIKNNNNSSSLKKTTNGGDTWFPTVNEGFYDMYFVDSLTGLRANDYIKKTTNGGLNWIQQQLPQGTNGQTIVWGIRSLSKFSNDTIWGSYAFAYFPNNRYWGIVYRTTNGGTNWLYQIPDTTVVLSAQYNNCVFINKRIGWAYSLQNGIHTTVGGDTVFLSSVHQISSEVPKEYKLFQNYPNPFNPVSNIKYQIKRSAEIKIIVFDIAGKEITTLVNKKQSPGIYEVTFDGGNLPSGIYFYTLFVDGVRADAKKAVLLK